MRENVTMQGNPNAVQVLLKTVGFLNIELVHYSNGRKSSSPLMSIFQMDSQKPSGMQMVLNTGAHFRISSSTIAQSVRERLYIWVWGRPLL